MMMSEDIDKRIAEIGEHTPGPWEIDRFAGQSPYLVATKHDVICIFRHHARIRTKDMEANARLIALAPKLLNQLKACREELRTALDTANRSSKAVLKWNAEIEQRTKETVRDSILENCEPKTEYGPHGLHTEWYTADDIEQAIDSVGKK